MHDRLLLALVEDAEIVFGEAGENAAVRRGDFGIDVDQRDAGVEESAASWAKARQRASSRIAAIARIQTCIGLRAAEAVRVS